jgi:hypothetical protein
MNLKPWKIYPDLVPHDSFHKGYWLNIDGPESWYYFFPTNRPYKIPSNDSFYNTLDNDLIKIVKLLHSNNIPTTPSCSGHFDSQDHYVKIYERLLNNASRINTGGVILNNPETGKRYLYKNRNYKLPWNLETFVDKSVDYQTKGVLGFVDPNGTYYNLVNSDFDCGHDNGITLVFENSTSKQYKSSKWNELYEVMANYLLV